MSTLPTSEKNSLNRISPSPNEATSAKSLCTRYSTAFSKNCIPDTKGRNSRWMLRRLLQTKRKSVGTLFTNIIASGAGMAVWKKFGMEVF